jgi:hypothetical protein
VRSLLAGVALLAATCSVAPASAFVVEVTTSVPIPDPADGNRLSEAVRSAIDEVLSSAVAFQPTLIVLTHAAVVGARLYIRLLLADREGERTFRELAPDQPVATESADLRI